MINDLASAKVLSQLEGIIRGRYGREIQIVRLMNLGATDSQTSVHSAGAEVHIPLTFEDLFLGQAVLRGDTPMQNSDIERAAATVKLALEPVLYREYLVRQEENQIAHLQNKNLDIRPRFLSIVDSKSETGSGLLSSLIFLQGRNPEFVRQVAIEIHEQSSFWSFVQLKDLIKSVGKLEELESMSLTTILVDSNDLQNSDVEKWVRSLADKNLNELLVLVHKNVDQLVELELQPTIDTDRLPIHRLLRIESIQMLLKKSYN